MIVFDLRCDAGHVFEAWFKSSEAFQAQCGQGLVRCPHCGSEAVDKAVMAPAVGVKGNRQAQTVEGGAKMAALLPAEAKAKLAAMASALAAAQAEALKESRWVGDRFADRARAMHYGEEPQAPIHGTTGRDEAHAMIEEGIAVAPLLIPIPPPDQVN